jgi:serpin B
MNINVQPLVESNNDFALDLYAKLSEAEGNLCISPFSIYTALAMTYAGARNTTEKQMKDVMHTSLAQNQFHKDFFQLLKQISAGGDGKNVELLLANSIYPHNRHALLESFVIFLKENYDTIISPLDYNEPETAREFINQWVKEGTKEHISDLIPPGTIDSLTQLVLVNAIYFKGLWKEQFDKQFTIESPFWILHDYAVKVPTMRQKGEFGYMEDDLVQVLELPYQDNTISLVVILPKERLSAVEEYLTYSNIAKWMKRLQYDTVDVQLPSFKIESKKELNDALISMGMTDAFNIAKADFSGMDGMKHPDGLFIQYVFHQANIEVNEEGTTASAATAVVMKLRGIPQEFQFHANRPFIFLLRENTTDSILFIGRIQNPLE